MTNKNNSIFKKLLNAILFLPRCLLWPFTFWRKKKPDYSLESLAKISWQEFEPLLHGIFKQRGYSVAEKQGSTFDGVDLVLQRDNEATYVKCKQWKEQEIDVTDVGELYVAMEADGIKYGIVITTGIFTPDAIDFSLGKALLLINGDDLSQMIEALQKSGVTR